MRTMTTRWAGWAQSLRSRHARIASRHQPAAMRLVRPRGVWTLAPSFHQHKQVWVTVRSGGAAPATAPRVVQAFLKKESPAKGAEARKAPPRGNAAVKVARPAAVQVVKEIRNQSAGCVGAKTVAARAVRWEARIIGESIAQAVRMRTARTGEAAQRLRAAGVSSEPRAIVRRVVERFTRREEQPVRQAMALRPATPSPAPAQAQRTIESELAARTKEDRESVQALPPAQLNPVSNINVDSLTNHVMDQIDRRIVAWRERMGRF